MKNDFARRLAEVRKDCINEGMRHGQQYALDMVMIYLHRNGWGYERIKRMVDGLTELSDYYSVAMHRGMEQDVMQERMDAEIEDIIKGKQEFIPFNKRYPLVINTGYDKLPKEERGYGE